MPENPPDTIARQRLAEQWDTGNAYQVAYATNRRAKTKGSKSLKQAEVLKQIL